jgi:precorrin-2 dehydrogenase/sirohydrochlorin ferrochelatase
MFYPVFLNLRNRRCVVAGGGTVASRKVDSLLRAGAEVTVISPACCPRIELLVKAGRIQYFRKACTPADVKEAFVVICATDDEKVNQKVANFASSRNIPVNVVDRPGLGNFIVPSSVSRGRLQIGISTAGASPALARRIRKELQERYGPEYGWFLDFMSEVRPRILKDISEEAIRKKIFTELAGINVERLMGGSTKVAARTEFNRFLESVIKKHAPGANLR